MSVSPLLIVTGLSRVLTIATQIVVGFYLTPGAYGEFAVALSMCTIVSLFQSGDLSRVALQDKETTLRSVAAVRSFLLAGCLATAVVVLCILLVGRERINSGFVSCLVLLPFLRVMANTRVTLLSAQGDSTRIAGASAVEAITRSSTSIGLAMAGVGAWSLVFGEVCAMLASVFALNRVCAGPGDRGPDLSPAVASGVAMMTLSSLLNLVERELPVFAAGLTLEAADAGNFAFAQRIATQLMVVVWPMIAIETIPRLLATGGRGEQFRAVALSERRRLGWICAALVVLLGLCAPFAMYILWGARWLGSIQTLPALAVATLLRVGYLFNRGLLEARGQMSTILRLAILDAALIVVSVAASLALRSILALTLALTLEALLIYGISRVLSVPD